jgi:hypothetical protein
MVSAVDREATEEFGHRSDDSARTGIRSQQTAPENEVAPDLEPLPLRSRHPLTIAQQRQLWKRVRAIENFWESLDELEPGAVARLWTTSQEGRWEVIFLTKRPETAGRTSQLQSQLWLQRHGFPMPSVFVVQGSRGRIAAALDLDFVVDDTPENCVDVVAESRAKAILISPEPDDRIVPSARRLGIGVVPSILQCLDLLAAPGGHAGVRASVVDRLMRLLKIKDDRRPSAPQ